MALPERQMASGVRLEQSGEGIDEKLIRVGKIATVGTLLVEGTIILASGFVALPIVLVDGAIAGTILDVGGIAVFDGIEQRRKRGFRSLKSAENSAEQITLRPNAPQSLPQAA